ncbi:transglutaminase family protein, partial [Aeromonas salmonicida]
MNPRQAFFACLHRSPPALLEAALWIAAEHAPQLVPERQLEAFKEIQLQIGHSLPPLPANELGQPLLRRMNDLGFQQDEHLPLRPQAALMDKVLESRRGQPLALALIAL